ncbi:Hypothetical protein VS_1256 [Vibrio atlanticus]|uniref:Uncharacterized protein n=1 Tax=Vibrio atlanticus (strain LGP32) TaxID=575788 RepID=B7VN45_VIBA3|nr:Hypothetical protein VS_1256 [Vibrio atlanticus]
MDGESVIGVLKAFHFRERLSAFISGFQVFIIEVPSCGTSERFGFYLVVDSSNHTK